jgi:hypothetical protein
MYLPRSAYSSIRSQVLLPLTPQAAIKENGNAGIQGINPPPRCLMAQHPAVCTNPVYKEQLLLATLALIGKGILFPPLGKTNTSVG